MTSEQIEFIAGLIFVPFTYILILFPLILTVVRIQQKKNTWYFLVFMLCLYILAVLTFIGSYVLNLFQAVSLFITVSIICFASLKIDDIKRENPQQKINLFDILHSSAVELKDDAVRSLSSWLKSLLILWLILFILFIFLRNK